MQSGQGQKKVEVQTGKKLRIVTNEHEYTINQLSVAAFGVNGFVQV